MRSVFASSSALPAIASLALAATASAGYTPLAFGPLTDPGNGAYYTNVYDISADGMSYTGLTNTFSPKFVSNGTTYTLTGTGGPFGMSADGQTVVGGASGQAPQRWNLADAVGNNIASTPIAFTGSVNAPAYATNHNATAFSISSPTGVISSGAFQTATSAFQAVDPTGFGGANRGIAAYAPVAVVLGFLPSNATNAYRWNYETGDITPLNLPAGSTSLSVGGVGTSLSGDASVIGGSAVIAAESAASQPFYWDAAGNPHRVPGVGSRTLGAMTAMNYTGTLGGGNLFGPGAPNHAFIYDFASDTSYDLNELFADFIPDGWILTTTTHISDDGSRIFARALAPDGSARFVLLEGDIPTPGAATLFALAGLAATRRRR